MVECDADGKTKGDGQHQDQVCPKRLLAPFKYDAVRQKVPWRLGDGRCHTPRWYTAMVRHRSVNRPARVESARKLMDFGDHLRTAGGALKNWAVAQFLDSLAVGVLWLIGLYILRVPLAPLWAVLAAVFQIVPHFGPILGLLGPVLAATLKWMDWEHPFGVLGL